MMKIQSIYYRLFYKLFYSMLGRWWRAWTIAKIYGFKLVAPFDGERPFWHPWHSPYPAFNMTWETYIDRIIEIETRKRIHERAIRFEIFRAAPGESAMLNHDFCGCPYWEGSERVGSVNFEEGRKKWTKKK